MDEIDRIDDFMVRHSLLVQECCLFNGTELETRSCHVIPKQLCRTGRCTERHRLQQIDEDCYVRFNADACY